MEPSRRIAWLITLGGAALFACSIVPMAHRIADYNAHANIPAFHAEPIVSRTLRVEGFPDATLTDVPATGPMGSIRLDIGEKSTMIPVRRPAAMNMPNLAGYDEWLKALAVYPVVRDEHHDQGRISGSEHLVIVVRRTPEGFDPETWGQVRRDEWLFDFYDIKRDGEVEHFTRRWPRTSNYGDPEARLRREAAGEGVEPARAATAKYLLQYEPLKDRSFEHFVAMFVIPKLSVPDYKFNDTAFRLEVLSWTLPCSMCAVLAFLGGLVFAIAPKRSVRSAAPAASPS